MSTTEIVNELQLGGLLGQGYFGEVRRGQIAPHGTIAAKVIDCAAMQAELGINDWNDLRTHLFAEAENLKRAEHANVVRVYSVHHSPSQDYVYIIVELCSGGSLEGCIRTGPLSLPKVKNYMRGALAGLEALHGRGMIHRDLKPGNILLEREAAKISDFGFVTDRLINGYASKQGYREHMAPEFFDVGVTSARTDVWAMGMTIYRLLNGEPWYAEVKQRLGIDPSDPIAAAARVEDLVTRGGFAQRLIWLPHVPDSWRRLVNKALHYDSTRRYQDGGQMLTAAAQLDLPETPWECTYGENLIVWRRRRDDRDEVVEWERLSERNTKWRAHTQARAGGRAHTLKRNNGPVIFREALKELHAFFGTRNT